MNTTYHIDAADRIVAVDAAWIAFAAANDAPDLPERVLGRPVWQFITNLTATPWTGQTPNARSRGWWLA